MGVGEESDHTHRSARVSPAFLSIMPVSLEAVEARGGNLPSPFLPGAEIPD